MAVWRDVRSVCGGSQSNKMAKRSALYGWPQTFSELSSAGWLCIYVLQIILHYVLPYLVVSRICSAAGFAFPWRAAMAVELAFHAWLLMVIVPSLEKRGLQEEAPVSGARQAWTDAMASVKAADAVGYPFLKFLSGWFLGADPLQIRHDNLVEWVCCMAFAREPQSVSTSQQQEAQAMAEEVCTCFGFKPASGYNSDLRFQFFFREPLFFLHRSCLQYVLTSMLPRLAVACVFRMLFGLRRECCKSTGIHYWWRASSYSGESQQSDLLFFHGLCGFTGYIPLLAGLLLRSSRGAVLVETEDVSQCLNFERRASRAGIMEAVKEGLLKLKLARGSHSQGRCIVLGHSLGSCAVAWVLDELRGTGLIAGAVLIDPVSILLPLPDVAFGFLYRVPHTAFDWLCFLWCSTEPGISFYFRRRFFWYNNMLKPEHLEGVPTLLCISAVDKLVPSETVRAYAVNFMPKATIRWWEGTEHTGFMGSPACTLEVVRWINLQT